MAAPARRPPASRPKGRTGGDRTTPRALPRVTMPAQETGARSAWSVQRFMIIGSIALLLSVLLGPTLKTYISQRGEISALRDKVAAQQADVAAMEHEKQLWGDPNYVAAQARERLNMVKIGEKAYTVIDATPTTEEKLVERANKIAANHPWYGQIWESTKLADNPQRASNR
ncbi:MAG: septum formation initiator family protein [Tetrasphaera jenkinsii]|jgi:cell division protein FtsB|uniref:Putative membrane protein n=1 Tax=Nostocoides jenkinsii Ben 74 TaxID=1193518 RepID=A0A077M930_9MICO|nr:septum formation initiator family protein [Tetrasphaera jenkinsii]MCI1263033.1 septum formation initiator family protein [Tetrasphaera jenkinsii]CCI53826.1 putative membrane protein [Tetrasphaera jenkinsii Ben 74]